MYNRKFISILMGALGIILLFSGHLLADTLKQSIHGNKALLPGGCGSCHKGHGVKGTPLLSYGEKDFCFSCHGTQERQREAMRTRKLSQGKALKNIEDDFKKVYHHPIEKQGIHSPNEVLPETDSSTPRHAVCVDCHNPHRVRKDNLLAGVDGSKKGARIKGKGKGKVNIKEYELCYKCHSYSVNLPGEKKNKEEEFDTQNRSYHPVEASGKNSRVPSLILPLTTSSTITCSDCHSADGYNAAKGPHGSKYEHILKKQYVKSINSAESRQNYELCYDCHRRENLLANASWNAHRQHINITSCKTCHNSHGSRNYPYLIDFNVWAVFPNTPDGRLDFVEYGEGNFDCFLRCHQKEHGRGGLIQDSNTVPKTGKK